MEKRTTSSSSSSLLLSLPTTPSSTSTRPGASRGSPIPTTGANRTTKSPCASPTPTSSHGRLLRRIESSPSNTSEGSDPQGSPGEVLRHRSVGAARHPPSCGVQTHPPRRESSRTATAAMGKTAAPRPPASSSHTLGRSPKTTGSEGVGRKQPGSRRVASAPMGTRGARSVSFQQHPTAQSKGRGGSQVCGKDRRTPASSALPVYPVITDAMRRGPTNWFALLPDDVLQLVLENLTVPDVCRCALVCRQWRHVVERESLWRYLFFGRWSNAVMELGFADDDKGGWRQKYMEREKRRREGLIRRLSLKVFPFQSNLDGRSLMKEKAQVAKWASWTVFLDGQEFQIPDNGIHVFSNATFVCLNAPEGKPLLIPRTKETPLQFHAHLHGRTEVMVSATVQDAGEILAVGRLIRLEQLNSGNVVWGRGTKDNSIHFVVGTFHHEALCRAICLEGRSANTSNNNSKHKGSVSRVAASVQIRSNERVLWKAFFPRVRPEEEDDSCFPLVHQTFVGDEAMAMQAAPSFNWKTLGSFPDVAVVDASVYNDETHELVWYLSRVCALKKTSEGPQQGISRIDVANENGRLHMQVQIPSGRSSAHVRSLRIYIRQQRGHALT